MTPDAQLLALGGDDHDPEDNTLTFRTQKEYEAWLAEKAKREAN